MQKHGINLIITGIIVVVLSGLEKILIFLALQGQGVHDNISLRNLTPSIIWNVPRTTFTIGILIFISGILFLLINNNFLKKQIELIKKSNEEFKKYHEAKALKQNENNDVRE